MTSKKKNKKSYLVVVPVLILLCIGYFSSRSNKIKLEKFGVTVGHIQEIEPMNRRGYFVKYNYNISGRQYYNTQKLTIKKELVSVGDIFEVKYSIEDKSVSELNFKKKINNE